jgi:tetratricopeptide (TPR) repeat protein
VKHRFSLILTVVFFALFSCVNDRKGETEKKIVADTARETIESLSARIASDGSNPLLYDQRAKIYLLDRQFDKALTDINKAITLSPKNLPFYITLSDIYLLAGQTKNCEESLQKALQIDPKNNEAILRLAKLHLVVRDYKATFEDLKRAIANDPINPQAYFTRAIALLEKGDTLRALDDLRKAVDQDQNYFEAYMELGELFALKRDKMAADYFRNALNVRPQSKEALYLLGMFYQETEQFEKAIETYTILSQVDTTFRNAPYNMGYINLVYLQDFPTAVKYFTEAIRRDPDYLEAWYNRGYASELAGDQTSAYSDYKMVLRLKTNYDKAIEGLNRLDNAKSKKK